MEKSKPCLFCGAKPHIHSANFVWCSNYKCVFGIGWNHIDGWNHRHLTPDYVKVKKKEALV